MTGDSVTLPISPEYFWGLVTLAALILGSIAAFTVLPRVHKEPPLETLKTRLGLHAMNSGVFFLAMLMWAVLTLVLFIGLLATIWGAIWAATPTTQPETWDWRFAIAKLAALTTVLGALVALPITLNRLVLTRQQANTASEALFNDKINAAARDLAARRTETRRVRMVTYTTGPNTQPTTVQEIQGEPLHLPVGATLAHQGPWSFHSEERDDLVTRAAAVDRLEGLARERPDEAPRIARLLAAYLRGTHPATNLTPTVPPFKKRPAQLDLQKAVEVLGRVHQVARIEDDSKWRLDLRGCNFDGVDFHRGFFFAADVSGSRFEAANLRQSDFRGALFTGSLLNYADFFQTDLTGAKLNDVKITYPEPVAGGMNDTINLATIKGTTFIASDLSAVDYLGTPDKIAETFGTGDTVLCEWVSDVHPGQNEFTTRWRLNGAMESGRQLDNAQEELVQELLASGFQNWSPHPASDLITGHLLRKLYERLDLLYWPYWDTSP